MSQVPSVSPGLCVGPGVLHFHSVLSPEHATVESKNPLFKETDNSCHWLEGREDGKQKVREQGYLL